MAQILRGAQDDKGTKRVSPTYFFDTIPDILFLFLSMRRHLVHGLLSGALASGGFLVLSLPAYADTCVTEATRAAATVINADTSDWEVKRICSVAARSNCLPSAGSDEAVLCCPPSVPGIPESQTCPPDTGVQQDTSSPPSPNDPPATRPGTWIPSDVQRCMRSGNCNLDHIVRTGAAFANFLFGLSGAVFLLTFVYAGFLYLTAGGSAENVKKAQKMLIDASVGMVLIFGASTLLRLVHKSITPSSRCE